MGIIRDGNTGISLYNQTQAENAKNSAIIAAENATIEAVKAYYKSIWITGFVMVLVFVIFLIILFNLRKSDLFLIVCIAGPIGIVRFIKKKDEKGRRLIKYSENFVNKIDNYR